MEYMRRMSTDSDGLRREIVALASKYAQRRVPYVEPVRDHVWNVAEVEPAALDCSSLVARVCLVALGDYFARLGDPSAEVWAGGGPQNQRTLRVIEAPLPGDLVFYQRKGDRNDRKDRGRAVLFHVAISDGAGNVLGACDAPECDRVVKHAERCPHGRWTLLHQPYRAFPL